MKPRTFSEALGFKGIFILNVDYGLSSLRWPQFGEMLLHFGEVKRSQREDFDDEFICYRFGEDDAPFLISVGDGYYFESHNEVEVGSEWWHAWLSWCRQKFEQHNLGN